MKSSHVRQTTPKEGTESITAQSLSSICDERAGKLSIGLVVFKLGHAIKHSDRFQNTELTEIASV